MTFTHNFLHDSELQWSFKVLIFQVVLSSAYKIGTYSRACVFFCIIMILFHFEANENFINIVELFTEQPT